MSSYLLNNVLIVDNRRCGEREYPELTIKCDTEELDAICKVMDIDILDGECEDIHLVLKLSGPIPVLETININNFFNFIIKPSSKNKVRVIEIEELDKTIDITNDEKISDDANSDTSEESQISEEDFPEPDHFDKTQMRNELLEKLEYHINNSKTTLKTLKIMLKEISSDEYIHLKTLNTIDNNLNELFEKK